MLNQIVHQSDTLHNLHTPLNNPPDNGISWVLLNQLNHVIPAKWKLKSSKFHIVLSAKSLFERLGDKEWVKKVYKKAEEKVEEDFDFLRIAESICEQLGDKTWVKKIYKQIEDNAEDSFSSEKKNKWWRLNYGYRRW